MSQDPDRDETRDAVDEQQALLDAARAVLEPLARLMVARGVAFSRLQEQLARAVVDAAVSAHPHLAPHRRVSRVAASTGINRREVTRLMQRAAPPRRRARSPASEVYAHWQATPAYLDAQGAPLLLPRTGPLPSFEALAQAVTRDVHPRSLLDELLRLQLAELDEARDVVALRRGGFVPGTDQRRMLQLMADNLGDHAAAAVDNVLGGGRRHFEQAVFAEGLSDASMDELKRLISAQWKLLLQAFVPPLERMIEDDTARTPHRRVRIGLYAYDETLPGTPAVAPPAPAAATVPKRRPRKPKDMP